jgi:hypothetical protein
MLLMLLLLLPRIPGVVRRRIDQRRASSQRALPILLRLVLHGGLRGDLARAQRLVEGTQAAHVGI